MAWPNEKIREEGDYYIWVIDGHDFMRFNKSFFKGLDFRKVVERAELLMTKGMILTRQEEDKLLDENSNK